MLLEKHLKEVRKILGHVGISEYLDSRMNKKKRPERISIFRLGSESRLSRYWETEEKRLCRGYKKKLESLKHVIEECESTGHEKLNWRDRVNGNNSNIARLK